MANSKISVLKVRNSSGQDVAYDIDAKTLNGKSNFVDTSTAQSVGGNKTFTGVLKIQNGAPSGAFVLGADVSSTTCTASQRKLGRVGIPSYDSNGSKTVAGISFDAQVAASYADFGGHPKNTSSIAPDVIRFVVADAHNNTISGSRTLALQISKQAGLTDSAGGGTSVEGAKFFIPVVVDGTLTATTIKEGTKNLSEKYAPISVTGDVVFFAGTSITPGASGQKSAKGVIFNDDLFTIDTTSNEQYPIFSIKPASTTSSGYMSSADKTNLDTLTNLLGTDSNDVVDKISEVLTVFEDYPEGSNIADVLAGKSAKTHTHSYTPEGTVSASLNATPTFTGTAATSGSASATVDVGTDTHTHTYNVVSNIEITQGTGASNYTPTGSVSASSGKSTVASSTHTHKYTPSGTVSTPTITITPSTTNVYSITAVGTLPSLSTTYTENTQTLAFSWSAGTLPTKGSATAVMTSATASSSQPTFTGSEGTTTSITGTTSVSSTSHSHTFTGTGVEFVATPSYSTSAISGTPSATTSVATGGHTHSVTATGTVSKPSITASFSGKNKNTGTASA